MYESNDRTYSDRLLDKHSDRQTDIQTFSWTDRQTNIHTNMINRHSIGLMQLDTL